MKRIILLAVCICIGFITFTAIPQARSQTTPTDTGDPILNIVNRYRIEAGQNGLIRSSQLSYSARQKSIKMIEQDCWSHNCGGSYVQDLKASGFGYVSAGENLAHGFGADYERLVRAWIDSPTHNAIMFGDYKYAGIGYACGYYQGIESNMIVVLHVAK